MDKAALVQKLAQAAADEIVIAGGGRIDAIVVMVFASAGGGKTHSGTSVRAANGVELEAVRECALEAVRGVRDLDDAANDAGTPARLH